MLASADVATISLPSSSAFGFVSFCYVLRSVDRGLVMRMLEGRWIREQPIMDGIYDRLTTQHGGGIEKHCSYVELLAVHDLGELEGEPH